MHLSPYLNSVLSFCLPKTCLEALQRHQLSFQKGLNSSDGRFP